ncbi:hypothetical protein [Corallococcus carmarthensis]|nr:hypothetical protein [Corallococcus carmarthensis]NOK23588.1 hypothetical protein [Corallococcus carmarthensis]
MPRHSAPGVLRGPLGATYAFDLSSGPKLPKSQQDLRPPKPAPRRRR